MTKRVSVVLLTYNCAHRLRRVLDHLVQLDAPVVAVDNASQDGTPEVLSQYPSIEVVLASSNIGAAARNVGVERCRTPYVAFCDDDGWYEPGALDCAAELLDRYPSLALVNARILVGAEKRLDPISAEMAASPLPARDGMPGTALLGFMAGACVVRKRAYCEVGGYRPEFFMGGEEEPLALALTQAGWQLQYVPEVVLRHEPSQANVDQLRAYGMRNALWSRWMYRRLPWAVTSSLALLRERGFSRDSLRGLSLALRGLPWAVGHRRVLPREIDQQLRTLDRHRRAHRVLHREHAQRVAATASPQ